MKKMTLFITLLFAGLNCFAQLINQSSELTTSTKGHAEVESEFETSAIEVPRPVYEKIVQWLEAENDLSLVSYLDQEIGKSELIDKFLKEYDQSNLERNGSYKTSGTETYNSGPCNCKTITPTDNFAQISPDQNDPYDNRIVDSDWNGQYRVWWKFNSDGPAYNYQFDGSGNDIHEDASYIKRNMYEKWEMLNLCTIEGFRSIDCNCDKRIFIEGEWKLDYQFKNSLSGYSDGYAFFESGFVGITAERDVINHNRYNLTNKDNMVITGNRIGCESKQNFLGLNYSDVWDSQNAPHNHVGIYSYLYNTIPHVFTLIHSDILNYSDADYSDIIGNVSDFQRIGADSSYQPIVNNYASSSRKKEIKQEYLIRANVPRVFVFASAISGFAGGGGNEYRLELRAQTNLFYSWKIPKQDAGYNAGQLEPNFEFFTGECCNLNIGKWSMRGQMGPLRTQEAFDGIMEHLNEDVPQTTPLSWQFAIGGETDVENNLIEIEDASGVVYSVSQCGNCDVFLSGDRGDGIPNFWSPTLTQSGSLCNSDLTVDVTNFFQLANPNSITLNIYHLQFGAWQPYIMGINPIAGSLPIQIGDEGKFRFEFITPDPDACVTIGIINIQSCDDQDGYDCLQDLNNFADDNRLEIFPNPFQLTSQGGEPEDDELTINWGDWLECPNFLEQKAPFNIKIFDVFGNPVWSSPSISGGSGSIHIPASAFPAPGTYVIQFTFKDFTYFSQVITVF